VVGVGASAVHPIEPFRRGSNAGCACPLVGIANSGFVRERDCDALMFRTSARNVSETNGTRDQR
jgi:hypothetical protein